MSAVTVFTGGELVDCEAIEIGELYQRAKGSLADSVKYQIECGQKLAEKKAGLPHGDWLPWLAANAGVLGFESDRTARMLMSASKQISNRKLTSDLDESTAAQISRQTWGNVAGNYKGQGTGQNEWYTPPEYIDLANRVMGGIDLDPASSEEANQVVKAARYFTQKDDGLAQQWTGRVWMNPPYSRELMPAFVEKLKQSYLSGDVEQAIMVSHNNTDTGWFHSLGPECSGICFVKNRIKFYRGEDVAAPVNGQAFFYLGDEADVFADVFGSVGLVLRPV